MRKAAWRLAGAIILLGLTANGDSAAFPSASAVIVHPDRLFSSDRIETSKSGNIDSAITEWKHDAQFTVTARLAGPDLGKTARISFIDRREWPAGKLFMIVHQDGLGRLWARRAWQEVGSQLCLSARQVAELGLAAAFSAARDNAQGQRCLKL